MSQSNYFVMPKKREYSKVIDYKTYFLLWHAYMAMSSNHKYKRTLVGNELVDHSNVVGAAPTGFILGLTPGFNGLGKDHRKTRRETFKFLQLVHLIL